MVDVIGKMIVKNERNQFWDFVIDKGLSTSNRLRKLLSIDETQYKHIVPYSHKKPKDYFAYRILDEIQKAATCLMRWKEFFSEKGSEICKEDIEKQIHRITLQAVYDEVNLRSRKLTESVAELILFSHTNEQIYYKDYLCFSEMISYQRDQSDRIEFYGFKNENAQDYISELKKEIKNIEQQGIDVSKRWYLESRKSIDDIKVPKFSTFRKKYSDILSLQKPDEITLIGKSYNHAYGESKHVHFSADDLSVVFDIDKVLLKIDKVAILIIHHLIKLTDLLGKKLTAEDDNLLSFTDNMSSKAFAEWTTSKANVGDYVAIGSDLAIVLEEGKSRYGFYFYKVKYVSEPPLPHIKEDYFAVFEIYRVGSKEELYDMVLNSFQKVHVKIDRKDIVSLDDKVFEDALIKSFKETYDLFKNNL